MLLSDVSVKRPVFASVISLLLIAFGLLSFGSLPIRELPDVDPPIVNVSTRYPGANAAVIETRVTQIIESMIAGVSGIKTIASSSSDGQSNIRIEFALERDIDAAANDVRDRVSRVLNNLPEAAEPPEVSKVDGDARPVMWLNLTSPVMDILQLTDYAERNIIDRLSVVDGVSNIRIGGGLRYALRIHLDRQAMAARNITVIDIETALRRENVELPAGKIESIKRDTIVRLNREYGRPEDFKKIVLREDGEGEFITIGDVAKVELGPERKKSMLHLNGATMVGLGIVKQSKGNTLAVASRVKAEVARIVETLPESMILRASSDTSVFISSAINEVYRTLAIAMGLVVLVLYLFLGNLKTVLVPAAVVPVCIIATFGVLSLAGLSINLITLLALVMSIGLVVDDAIVVLENIYRRVENGEPGLVAAYRGAKQVGFAVIATTLVLISVFVPVMFLPGNVGKLFSELAITMSAAVGISSLVALTLCPMLCSILVRRRNKKPKFAQALDRGFVRIQRGYCHLLEACLERKTLVVLSFLTCFFLIAGLQTRVPSELAPIEDRGFLFMGIRGPEGASHDYMVEQVDRLEAQVLPYTETGEIDRFLVGVGSKFGGGFGIIWLAPWEKRDISSSQIASELRQKFSQYVPGAFAMIFESSGLSRGSNGQEFQLVIGGATYDDLGRFKQVIMEELNRYEGLVSPDIDFKETLPQFKVSIDTVRAADLGVSVQSIGRTLEAMMGGRKVTTFINDGEEYDVVIQADQLQRMQPMDMENTHVKSFRTGELIALSNLVVVEEVASIATLQRFNRTRALTVSASIAKGYTLGEVTEYMENAIRQQLPAVTNIDYKGATREFKEAGNDIFFVFALALVVVFLVLAAQFESFIHPFIIMLTVPLAMLGGMLGLYFAGSTFNIYSQLGLIMLVGLAAKNGILIVEFANQMRDEGLSVRDALVEASGTRLRPIMMTGLSTAMGAVPLMIAAGAGSASRQTIGVTVFGGVIVATVFTLFVVPVFYDMLAKYTKSPNHLANELKSFEEKEAKGIPAE
ncbi:MAG: efflux RND transporter permease subunit [Kordiimonadaceae bacterium]|nr:efflux RND transporter permease subunit [Kordiimonadaceae bacterium]